MPRLYTHIYSINTKALIRCSGTEEYNLAETMSVSLPKTSRCLMEQHCSNIRENSVPKDL